MNSVTSYKNTVLQRERTIWALKTTFVHLFAHKNTFFEFQNLSLYYLNHVRSEMDKNNLIGQKVLTKANEELEVVEASGDDIKSIILKMKNKKIYNLYLGFKSGFIKFVDEKINNELNEFIKNEELEKEKIRLVEQETLRKAIEKERKEKEKLENAIKEFRDEYAFLSNFYSCLIEFEGYTYQNAEAAFQAQKDLSRRNEFTSLNPVVAKRLGKKVNLRSDWEEVKVDIMRRIVKCKFEQNPDLKEKLINTGDRLLIEGNTWNDTFWGVCKEKGKNMLGIILMELRAQFQA